MPIKIDGKFVYVNEKDIIVDNTKLVARPWPYKKKTILQR
jgi:hypothetical protein